VEPEERSLPLFLTVEEAAAVLRLKRSTAYELVRRGEIPHFRLGYFIRVPRDALLRMAEGAGQKVQAAGGAK
jgi:excisionase family DNA binding protein